MEPARAPAMPYIEELDRGRFDRSAAEWDRLAERSMPGVPFVRHAFLRAHLDNLEAGKGLRLLVCREGPRLLAALPLIEERVPFYGLPITRLRSVSGVHSNRFDALCEPGRPDALRVLWSHLAADDRWELLELRDVPEGGNGHALRELARADGHPSALWESMRSPYVRLGGGLPAVSAQLDAKFRSNLRRRHRKLGERGRLELERFTGGPELEARLEEGFLLEQAGWKGRGRTAIACDPRVRGFYAEYARSAALAGELSCYFLRVDGRPVAFHFGLTTGGEPASDGPPISGPAVGGPAPDAAPGGSAGRAEEAGPARCGTYFMPKVAYDETLKECSPGQLLLEAVLRDCCDRGLGELDFLGPEMPWKRDWTDRTRLHHWVFVFGRGRRGRALQQLKFRWIPMIREVWQWKR